MDRGAASVPDIFDTIRKYHMIEEGMHVIAGVSGGADSVCLLYVLCEYRRQLPFELSVVHVEHGLRGEESLEDAGFTRKLCGRLGVPCRVVHAQVERLARAEGISIEEAGRRERYRIFREVMEECGAQRVAVAHNRDDQAETVLWNLARGSGLRGLGGMSPVRGELIRPLLFTDRERIEQILTEAGLPWRTDRTNLQQEYTRNRIRLSILPQMEQELNGRAAEHIAGAAERLRQVQEYLDRMTAAAAKACVRRDGDSVCVELDALLRQDALIREELLKAAVSMCGGTRDFGSIHLRALLRLCGLDCGKELRLPGGLRAVREDGIVRLIKKNATVSDGVSEPPEAEIQTIPVPGAAGRRTATHVTDISAAAATEAEISVCPGKAARSGSLCVDGWRLKYEFLENSPGLMCQIVEKKYTKWLSCDTINYNALQLRTRRTGDYLVINAAGGRRKLKDYLIDCKVPRDQRDRVWLLTDGPHVLWAIGCRISEAAKVTEDTETVLKVQLEESGHEGKNTDLTDGTGSK